MADLLILVGTLAFGVGVWSLVRPVQRLGITDRKRAAQVTGIAVAVMLAGGALAGPPKDEPVAPVALAAPAETTTTALAPTTSSIPLASSTSTDATTTEDSAEVVVQVTEIIDGDTVIVSMPDGTKASVRLIGIDAPERSEERAAAAAQVLERLVAGHAIAMTADVSDRDRFGRLLRYLWIGDRLVNEELVAAGVAVAKRYAPDTAFAETLEAAQASAQVQALGIWTTPTSTSTTTTTVALVVAVPTTTESPECHPSYVGECVPVGVEDVDCRGGSGNGPFYVGRVTVVGWDEYGLDRDNDGIGCEGS